MSAPLMKRIGGTFAADDPGGPPAPVLGLSYGRDAPLRRLGASHHDGHGVSGADSVPHLLIGHLIW